MLYHVVSIMYTLKSKDSTNKLETEIQLKQFTFVFVNAICHSVKFYIALF